MSAETCWEWWSYSWRAVVSILPHPVRERKKKKTSQNIIELITTISLLISLLFVKQLVVIPLTTLETCGNDFSFKRRNPVWLSVVQRASLNDWHLVRGYCSLCLLLEWMRGKGRPHGVVFHYLFTLQQYFSICGCIDIEWNPQMSQIGLSQLCRGLALSAVLVQGYWNCFDLASPSWIETTRKLHCCRKKKKKKGLKFYWSPAQSVPHTLSVYGRTPLPLTSPHFVSCSVYISLSVSHLLFHHILHLLHPASSVVSVKLIPVLLQIPPQPATCGEPSPNVTKRTWYQLNRSALSGERSECSSGPASICSQPDENVRVAPEPKVRTFLKSLSLCLSPSVRQTYVSRLIQHLCFVKHITVTQGSGAKNNNTC